MEGTLNGQTGDPGSGREGRKGGGDDRYGRRMRLCKALVNQRLREKKKIIRKKKKKKGVEIENRGQELRGTWILQDRQPES